MKNNDPLTWVCRTNSNHLGFESSVKEKDHQTELLTVCMDMCLRAV